MTLCDPCQKKSDGWLDYRLPRQAKIASGAAYDDTVAGVRDGLSSRFELWRTTIRQQQEAIRRFCEEEHQAAKGIDSIDIPGVITNDPRPRDVTPGADRRAAS